jgi:ribose transport system substrate-binding protein
VEEIMRRIAGKWLAVTAAAAVVLLGGAFTHQAGAQEKKKITIGLVAKSQSNPVFQAAYKGAQDAAKELGAKYNADVTIDWQTPASEDAQKQAQAIEQLSNSGAQGIAVSCSDANAVTPAINKAVENGSQVVCFDSDAPRSKRFAFYGTDDLSCGQQVMDELAKIMNKKGTVAVLAGNQTAPNLQTRVKGVKEVLKKNPDMKLLDDGVFYHVETPEEAAKAVQAAQSTNPGIEGWAMVGGWPLFTRDALKWNPGEVKVVAVDALPAQLPYLKSGHVQLLLAQDCYGWGYQSVDMLLKKLLKDEAPPQPRVIAPLTPVTKETADEFA